MGEGGGGGGTEYPPIPLFFLAKKIPFGGEGILGPKSQLDDIFPR